MDGNSELTKPLILVECAKLSKVSSNRDKNELLDEELGVEHRYVGSAADEIAGAAGQIVKRRVALEHDRGVLVDRLEYAPDHLAVDVAEEGILRGRLAHLDAGRMERHVAVLWRGDQEHVFEVLERRLFAQLVEERLARICVVFEAQLQQTARLLPLLHEPQTHVDQAARIVKRTFPPIIYTQLGNRNKWLISQINEPK